MKVRPRPLRGDVIEAVVELAYKSVRIRGSVLRTIEWTELMRLQVSDRAARQVDRQMRARLGADWKDTYWGAYVTMDGAQWFAHCFQVAAREEPTPSPTPTTEEVHEA